MSGDLHDGPHPGAAPAAGPEGRSGRPAWHWAAAGGAVVVVLGVAVLAWNGLGQRAEPSASASASSGPSLGPTSTASQGATPSGTASASVDTEPAAPSPEPSSGPTDVLPTAAPVPLDESADFGTGVSAIVDAVESLEAKAVGPGEVSGPALSFALTLTNDAQEPVDLARVTVTLTDAQGNPGVAMLGPPARAFTGALAPGRSAMGTYVFAIGQGARSPVRLEVAYSTAAPVVVFTGDVPSS